MRLMRNMGLMALLALSGLIVGCAAVGPNPTPPSKFESLLYNTATNYVTVVQTNTVKQVVPVFETNQITLTVTNQQNQVVTTVSNVVNQVWQTNTVQQVATNQVAQYTETVKPSVASGTQAAGGILNVLFPGVGSIASQALLALLGGWAFLRSNKQGNTASAMAQEVESIREFIKVLPNGAAYDTAITNFLQQHQTEAGVVQQVMAILQKDVSNPDAKAGAQAIANLANALKSNTQPVPPITS